MRVSWLAKHNSRKIWSMPARKCKRPSSSSRFCGLPTSAAKHSSFILPVLLPSFGHSRFGSNSSSTILLPRLGFHTKRLAPHRSRRGFPLHVFRAIGLVQRGEWRGGVVGQFLTGEAVEGNRHTVGWQWRYDSHGAWGGGLGRPRQAGG